MDLGLDFEDSDFVQEEKQRPLLTSYNAKICSPQWFLDEKADNSLNDKATLYKFRGDYYYRLMVYNQAIQCYDVSLGNLGSQNRTMRREVTESLARCHVNLGHTDKAVELSDQVLNDCLTKDQTVQGLILKQQIYQKAGLLAEEIRILYRLIHVHPRNVEFWSSIKSVFETIQTTQPEQRNELLSETCKMSHQLVIDKERQPNQCGIDTNCNPKAMPRDVKDITTNDKSVKGIFDKDLQDVCDGLIEHDRTSTTLTKDSNCAMRTSAETLEQNLASLSTESQAMKKVDSNCATRTTETLEQNLASLSTESQAINKVDSNRATRTTEKLEQNLASLSTESQAINKVDSNCAMRTSAETLEQNLASLSTEPQAANMDMKQTQYSTSNGFIDDGSDYDDILTGLSCRLLVLTCCVRIRLILQSVQGTVGSFIKKKNLELQKQIDRQISSMEFRNDVLQRVTEFMKKDMFEDDYGESNSVENEDKEIPTLTAVDFNRRWFSWIQDT